MFPSSYRWSMAKEYMRDGRHLEQGDGADPGHAGQSNWITQATYQAVIVELHTGDAVGS